MPISTAVLMQPAPPMTGNFPATTVPPAFRQRTGDRLAALMALDAVPGWDQPATMTTLETVQETEHRCEALTIGDIPPYRCTTSATAERRGRAVCASHASALRIRWFDGDE
jgi:hypothetical protein